MGNPSAGRASLLALPPGRTSLPRASRARGLSNDPPLARPATAPSHRRRRSALGRGIAGGRFPFACRSRANSRMPSTPPPPRTKTHAGSHPRADRSALRADLAEATRDRNPCVHHDVVATCACASPVLARSVSPDRSCSPLSRLFPPVGRHMVGARDALQSRVVGGQPVHRLRHERRRASDMALHDRHRPRVDLWAARGTPHGDRPVRRRTRAPGGVCTARSLRPRADGGGQPAR
jgi:hypothetical protein